MVNPTSSTPTPVGSRSVWTVKLFTPQPGMASATPFDSGDAVDPQSTLTTGTTSLVLIPGVVMQYWPVPANGLVTVVIPWER